MYETFTDKVVLGTDCVAENVEATAATALACVNIVPAFTVTVSVKVCAARVTFEIVTTVELVTAKVPKANAAALVPENVKSDAETEDLKVPPVRVKVTILFKIVVV